MPHPEQSVNELALGEDIPLRDSLDLTFAEHMHGFIALNGPLGCGERPKPQPRIHAAFDKYELRTTTRYTAGSTRPGPWSSAGGTHSPG
jgi:hypothetical protein